MESSNRRIAGRTVTAVFGTVSVLAIAYFEIRTDAISTVAANVVVAYFSFVITMSTLAFMFSGWYLPKTGYFEVIVLPVLLPFIAALVAGLVYAAYVGFVGEGWSDFSDPTLTKVAAFGVFAGAGFLRISWPVLTVFGGIGSCLLFIRLGRDTERAAV
jgi:hypothetical protein